MKIYDNIHTKDERTIINLSDLSCGDRTPWVKSKMHVIKSRTVTKELQNTVKL